MFDLWQKMVNPSAYPLQSLMFPVMNAEELQKKLHELEVVEHWLKANVNMVQLTQKTLQYQLAMIKGAEKAQSVLAGEDRGKPVEAPSEDMPNPAMWAWNLMAEAAQSATSAYKPDPPPSRPAKPRRKKKG